jgi:hypothetical protein
VVQWKRRAVYFTLDGIATNGIINVATMPVMGGKLEQLTYDRELAGWACWSPDGQFLALEIKRGDDTHIAIIPSQGGEPVQVTFARARAGPTVGLLMGTRSFLPVHARGYGIFGGCHVPIKALGS